MKSLKDLCDHQSDIYYVKRSIDEASLSTNTKDWSTILELYFDKIHAKELRDSISRNKLLDHQSLEYWMCLFVEYVYNRVNSKCRFQNNGIMLSQWFDSEGTSETGTFGIKCMNVGSNFQKTVWDNDDTFPLYKPDDKFWYHGTTQESAESIRRDGIKLEEGCDAQDFSHSSGFYVNPEFDKAKKWALCRFEKTAGAVLIYKFSLDGFEGINLHNDQGKWKEVVQYYRNRCPYSMGNAVKKELRKVDYIIGPMSAYGVRERRRAYVPHMKRGTSQLCVRSENMAIKVTSALCGIIYFNY